MKLKMFVVSALAGLFTACTTGAAVITSKDGKAIEGEVVSYKNGEFTIVAGNHEHIISAARIERIDWGTTLPSASPEPEGPAKCIDDLPTADQEIIKKLKFFDPVIGPLDQRNFTFIKGTIELKNFSAVGSIMDKLDIEIRLLCRNRDKQYSVIKCCAPLTVNEKGSHTVGIMIREKNQLFETLNGGRDKKVQDEYVVVRYMGVPIYEEPAKARNTFPTDWWKDDALVYQP